MTYTNALGVEFREVEETTRGGQAVRVVVGTRSYPTDSADLWDALTNPERIPRWFLPIAGDLRPGGRYSLEGNASGTIERCDSPTALDLTWEFAGSVSWVAVRLEPTDDGTRLTLKHSMLKDDAGEAHWEQFGPGATGVGWDLSFLGLGWFLDDGGQPLDRETIDAWMASNAGKQFIRECAEAWAEAHIKAGESPETARAMAQRTAAAYTEE